MLEDRETTSLAIPAPFTRRWTDRFAIDLAMHIEGSGDPPEVLIEEHGYTKEDLVAFSKDPLFMQRVESYKKDIQERGLSFKLKAKAQAEELLKTSWSLIHDDRTSPAVKAQQIQWTAKMAGYEPTKDGGAQQDGGVTINIHMGGGEAPPPGMRTIEHE